MSLHGLKPFVSLALAAAAVAMSSTASAVGDGLPFVFDEGQVDGALAHVVDANSMDFTYHACVKFTQQTRFRESGYFWVSSFQDADSEVDSQLNYFDNNGYRIYGIYTYKAQQWGNAQPTPSGSRLNYTALLSNPSIALYLDTDQDTVLDLQNCRAEAVDDDIQLGSCNAIAAGEKSETDGLANGDFEVIYGPNWVLTPMGQLILGNPAAFNFLVFNGNVTAISGPIGADHKAEGSGNLFWRDTP